MSKRGREKGDVMEIWCERFRGRRFVGCNIWEAVEGTGSCVLSDVRWIGTETSARHEPPKLMQEYVMIDGFDLSLGTSLLTNRLLLLLVYQKRAFTMPTPATIVGSLSIPVRISYPPSSTDSSTFNACSQSIDRP
jgi:hypothetical protein